MKVAFTIPSCDLLSILSIFDTANNCVTLGKYDITVVICFQF